MSSITIGRAVPDNVIRWNAQGDSVDLAGVIFINDVDAAKSIRQQLLGYINSLDEPVVPVTSADDPTVDGYYRVLDGHVDIDGANALNNGNYPFGLKLERVPGYALPLIESVMVGALRTNSAGIAPGTEVSWFAFPSAALSFNAGDGTAAGATRVSADGNIAVASGSTFFHTARPQLQIAPASFYVGAAKLEIGSTLRTVIGRQIVDLPANWRLSNGLLRITPNVASTVLRLDISCFDGTQWDPVRTFQIVVDGNLAPTVDLPTAPSSITVLRNSPEAVIIRIGFTSSNWVLDLCLRRGARMVYGYIAKRGVIGAGKVGIRPVTGAAATSLTGGQRATSNDADGNRFVVTSPNAITKDAATGLIYLTAGAFAFSFAAGFEVGGSGAAGIELAQSLVYQYMAADTERMMVVGR